MFQLTFSLIKSVPPLKGKCVIPDSHNNLILADCWKFSLIVFSQIWNGLYYKRIFCCPKEFLASFLESVLKNDIWFALTHQLRSRLRWQLVQPWHWQKQLIHWFILTLRFDHHFSSDFVNTTFHKAVVRDKTSRHHCVVPVLCYQNRQG